MPHYLHSYFRVNRFSADGLMGSKLLWNVFSRIYNEQNEKEIMPKEVAKFAFKNKYFISSSFLNPFCFIKEVRQIGLYKCLRRHKNISLSRG